MALLPTARQAEVLALLERGFGVAEIAGQLGVSVHTVRTHLDRVINRLGLRDQEALRYFLWKKVLRERMRERGLHNSLIEEILEGV